MLKRLILVAFGVTLALVMVEVGLRQLGPLVDPAAKNQWLGCVGWAGQPHQQEHYYTDEFSSIEIINSAGLPDVEHTYEKPDGVFRILIIGDSFVESYQVNLEKSFPRLLEARLNEKRSAQDPRFEVIKAGYRAWGTDQEWLYFQCEGYKYEPDLVLLGFTINDVPDNYLPLKARMAQWPENAPPKPYYTWEEGQLKQHNFPFPPPPAEVQPQTLYDYLYKYSLSYRVAEKGWQSLKLKIAELSQPPAALELEPGESRYPRWTIQFSMPLYMTPLPAEHEAAWQLTEALLRAFHQEVVAKGFKFAVYSNSTMWTVHPSIQEILISEEPLYASAKFDWLQPDRRLGENLQAMNVPYLLLDPLFREQSVANNEQLLFFREGHWNEAGHQLAAELIYRWLIEQRLVP